MLPEFAGESEKLVPVNGTFTKPPDLSTNHLVNMPASNEGSQLTHWFPKPKPLMLLPPQGLSLD